MLENYSKMISIEAHTMIYMAQKEILPASIKYAERLCNAAAAKKALSESISCNVEIELAERISALTSSLAKEISALDKALLEVKDADNPQLEAQSYHELVIPATCGAPPTSLKLWWPKNTGPSPPTAICSLEFKPPFIKRRMPV